MAYNSAYTGAQIDGAVAAVRNKEAAWDSKPSSLKIGTTTTGEPGTNASVSNSGSNTDLVLDFVIPKGETGYITNAEEYFTSEQQVGTWIDGKPLYRRVFTGTLGSSGTTTVGTVSNADKFTDLHYVAIDKNNIHVAFPQYSNLENYGNVWTESDTIFIGISTHYYGASYILVAEYTKTTDAAAYALPSAAEMAAAYDEGVQAA